MGHPTNIVLLVASVTLLIAFIFWEQRQERRQAPALIPNSLWQNSIFTCICLMVMCSFAVINAMEVLCSLLYVNSSETSRLRRRRTSLTATSFQQVQNLDALQASIRILPSLMVATLGQLSTGLLIHKMPVYILVLASLSLNGGAPLLMALANPGKPYWYNAFFAQLLAPISNAILFTIGLLIVSDVFPPTTQALAGAVFNTVAQFGISLGLTIISVISTSVTNHSKDPDKTSPAALLVGYRASFWACAAWIAMAVVTCAVTLRKVGKVGSKRD